MFLIFYPLIAIYLSLFRCNEFCCSRSIDWLIDLWVDCFDLSFGWLIDLLIDWSIFRLIDWLIDVIYSISFFSFFPFVFQRETVSFTKLALLAPTLKAPDAMAKEYALAFVREHSEVMTCDVYFFPSMFFFCHFCFTFFPSASNSSFCHGDI